MKTKITNSKEAEIALAEFKSCQAAKAGYDKKMADIKESLREFGEKNRKLFTKGKLELGSETMRFAHKSEVQLAINSDVIKIIKSYPELVKQEFSVSRVKAAFTSPDRIWLQRMGMKIVHGEEFKID